MTFICSKQKYPVGGLDVQVYSDPSAEISSSCPLAVIFLLHGRTGSAADVEPVAHYLIEQTRDRRLKSEGDKQLDLLVVTFDHRNHGGRVISSVANQGWSKDTEKNNERHAIDMYSIQTGTANDVSFLIDFLPSYLFPFGERTVSRWMIAGISLGGHSTWIALKNDPRLTLGVPIIGCPNYLKLVSDRAQKAGVAFEPPYMPISLLTFIHKEDPVSSKYDSVNPSENPFFGKKILVLSGGKDQLVPWSASQDFVERLHVGDEGTKISVVVPEAGHECHPVMMETMAKFIWDEA